MEHARMEEYRTVMENYAQLAMRRQNLNSLFVGLNAFFLTALGFLLTNAHFDSWLLVWESGVITAVILPMNVTWLVALARYRFMIDVHSDYLKAIEREFEPVAVDRTAPNSYGIISAMDARAGNKHYGTTGLEKGLALFFVFLYPLITLAAAGLTYAVAVTHLLQPVAPL